MSIQPLETFRAAHFIPYLDFLYEKGIRVDQILGRFNLPIAFGDHASAAVPLLSAMQFISYVEKKEDLDDLEILIGVKIGIDLLSVSNRRAILSAPNLRTALDVFLRSISSESSSAEGWIAVTDENVRVCQYHRVALKEDELRPIKNHFLLLTLAIIRVFAGANWNPSIIGIESRVPCAALGRRFPETRFIAGQRCSWISVPKELLRLTKHKTNRSPLHTPVLEPLLVDTLENCTKFTSSLKGILKAYLTEGYPNITLAAEITGTSVRTLQRNLALSSITYSKLIEIARFEAAVEMLAHPDNKIIDIAYAVGYQDPSHFSRAFRRFVGTSPREYRLSGAA